MYPFLPILSLCLILFLPHTAGAREKGSVAQSDDASLQSSGADTIREDGVPAVLLDSGKTLLLFPTGALYPRYIADPHRVGFGIQMAFFSRTGIAESGDSRVVLRLGGSFGIVRVHPPGQPDRGWQLNVEGGFDGQFDADFSLDNIGWDGNYAITVTSAGDSDIAVKFGMLHTSSHVGDEYNERIIGGRPYTRHELLAAMSWAVNERWRTYIEGGWGYDLRNEELMEPGRMQVGVEFEDAESLWQGRMGWYTALDVSAMEERDWRMDTSLQAGVVFRSRDRKWRFGIERYDGRPPIGEFFQDTETYTALGVWMDI